MSYSDVFHDTIKNLFLLAKKDGILSEEEADILNRVKIDLKKYSALLDKALVDGVINTKETKNLTRLKKQIIKGASEVAEKDGKITDDEKVLILKLSELLERYYG